MIIDNTNERKWEILKSEYLIKRPWFTARKDMVKMPSGVINDEFYILEYPDWVNIIAITKDNQFVMIRQYRHGIQQTRYELCAGVVDPGEQPLEAAKRELFEETGYGNGKWHKLMTISGNTSTTNNYTHCFIATGVEKISTQHLEQTEDITIHLMTKEEVLELIKDNHIVQSLMLAPLWRFFAENK